MDDIDGLPIAMAAVAVQGMGFSLSFMVLSAFVYRLMTQKLPRDTQRPGVFISIGPSGFTTAGIGESSCAYACTSIFYHSSGPNFGTVTVQLGGLAADYLPVNFMMPGMTAHAVFILKLLSGLIGVWLWGLSIWYVAPCPPQLRLSAEQYVFIQVLYRFGWIILEVCAPRTRSQGQLSNDFLFVRIPQHGIGDRHVPNRAGF